MGGRLDLRRPARPPPGHRRRRGRPQAVPLSPALARDAGPPEVRPHGGLRPGAAATAPARPARSALGDDELDETRVLACAIRLLDVGLFRVGCEQYADDEGGIGLATVHKDSVTVTDGELVFDYLAKGGMRRVQAVQDPPVIEVVRRAQAPAGRRRSAARLQGRAPLARRPLRADQRVPQGPDRRGVLAKDFRTWNATVLAAVSLAADGREAGSATARKRAINGAVRGVAEVLGNTPAVARRSYIDPRVFDRYLSGWTIGGELDRIGALARARRPAAHTARARGARSARRRPRLRGGRALRRQS